MRDAHRNGYDEGFGDGQETATRALREKAESEMGSLNGLLPRVPKLRQQIDSLMGVREGQPLDPLGVIRPATKVQVAPKSALI